MNRIVHFARQHVVDLLIVLAAVEAALDPALGGDPSQHPTTPLWFTAPALALVVLPLLFRHRYPFAGPVALWLLAALLSFVDGRLIVSAWGVYMAGIVAAFLLGNLRDITQARIGLAVVAVSMVVIVYNNPLRSTMDLVLTPLFFVSAWLAGFALRERGAQAEAAEERAARAERDREVAARIAVAEERARIARELHDIVAHSVSVMVLQVGAVRHKLPQTMAEDKEALKGVEETGRSALTEMRRLLGAMHDGSRDVELAPQPRLADLDALIKKVGRAGLPVRLHVDGDPFVLPRAIELSAYRIVQEGLTNALKHAHATRVDVTVRYHPDEIEVEIADDGEGAATSDGLGRGLVGMRERVHIYGGELKAGNAPGGGFVVSARLAVNRQGS